MCNCFGSGSGQKGRLRLRTTAIYFYQFIKCNLSLQSSLSQQLYIYVIFTLCCVVLDRTSAPPRAPPNSINETIDLTEEQDEVSDTVNVMDPQEPSLDRLNYVPTISSQQRLWLARFSWKRIPFVLRKMSYFNFKGSLGRSNFQYA